MNSLSVFEPTYYIKQLIFYDVCDIIFIDYRLYWYVFWSFFSAVWNHGH